MLPAKNNTCKLVAPRPIPLRLTSAPAEQLGQLKLEDPIVESTSVDIGVLPESPAGAPTDGGFSPRASSRSSLPTEALEEFLWILRPSFFPPSPTRRECREAVAQSRLPTNQLRRGANSVPAFHFHLQQMSGLLNVDEFELPGSSPRSPPPSDLSEMEKDSDFGHPTHSIRSYTSGALSSPISRTHTRNPFQRHPSYHHTTQPSPRRSPSVPLSPAIAPLPPPSPGEIEVA